MANANDAIRFGFNTAIGYAGVAVKLQRLTFGTPDAFESAAEFTLADTEELTVLYGAVTRKQAADMGENLSGMLTVNLEGLTSGRPKKGDRFEYNGEFYTVRVVRVVQDLLAQCFIAGPIGTATAPADARAPRISDGDLVGGIERFDYTATSDEAAIHRVRYRKPPGTGTFTTDAWSVTYVTALAGSVLSLSFGLYEVFIQAQDAAGNTSDWHQLGNVTVLGTPA